MILQYNLSATPYFDRNSNAAQEVIHITTLYSGPGRLGHLFEESPKALHALNLIQLFGCVDHREFLIMVPEKKVYEYNIVPVSM